MVHELKSPPMDQFEFYRPMTTNHSATKAFRASLTRILFAIHSLLAVWRLYRDDEQAVYFMFASIPILLFIEGAVTIYQRDSDEYKWFCPSVFIFLCGSVPPICLMEITESDRVIRNITVNETIDMGMDLELFGSLTWPVDRKMTLQALEQSLLVILVIGRWLLPKGRISRDQLSQLLLAYIAISSDIVELFNVFNEKVVREHMSLTLIVLGVWSVSLTQYALVVTTLSAKKVRPALSVDGRTHSQRTTLLTGSGSSDSSNLPRWWERTDIWGIIMTIFLQDGPFFALRAYLIFWQHVMSYTMLFFVAKNSLIISVQLYRLIVLCCEVAVEDRRKLITINNNNENDCNHNNHKNPPPNNKFGTTNLGGPRPRPPKLGNPKTLSSTSFADEIDEETADDSSNPLTIKHNNNDNYDDLNQGKIDLENDYENGSRKRINTNSTTNIQSFEMDEL